MLNRILVASAVCLGVLAVVVAAPAGKPSEPLKFPNSGFSIAPLDEMGQGTGQALIMFMPPSDGFAPNVNVQVQEFPGSMDDYRTLSLKQIGDMKLTIVSEQLVKGVFTMEYSGSLQGNDLHFCAKAIGGNGKVYLATGAAAEGQWKAVGAKIKECVDSFALMTAEAPAKAAKE
jgi:hypothetical protein